MITDDTTPPLDQIGVLEPLMMLPEINSEQSA